MRLPLPHGKEVSDLELCMPSLKAYLSTKKDLFMGGQIKTKLNEWEKLTSDPEVLQTVQGIQISFDQYPMTCSQSVQKCQFTEKEITVIDEEVQKLLDKRVIKVSSVEEGQVVSPIFVREKKDGSHRMILNLKALNENIEYQKFKMETLQTALALVTKNCYFASIDLRDAYYSVPVHEDYQKFLKFCWRGTLYVYQAAAMGLAPVPRLFTKLTKPILAHLHDLVHVITSFIDDSLLVGQSKTEVCENVIDTVKMFDALGFTIHEGKSQFIPAQEITYLGFVLNSHEMTVTLSGDRKEKLWHTCIDILKQPKPVIRNVASCIGLMVSSFPAVPLGPLYYRCLEQGKNKALQAHKGNWEKCMPLSERAKLELNWWVKTIMSQSAPIQRPDPMFTLKTDSSITGWGAFCFFFSGNRTENSEFVD